MSVSAAIMDRYMTRLTDDQYRDDLRARMAGADISIECVAKELGLTRARISQILQKGKPLPLGFYERVLAAMRRIHIERGKSLDFRAPADDPLAE